MKERDQPHSWASFAASDWWLIKQDAQWVLLFLLLATVPVVLLDSYFYESDAPYWFFGLVVFAANYALFVRMMKRAGWLENGQKTGIGTYFVLGLATGIPITLAGVIFILPGAYLLMRWLPAYGWAMTTYGGVSNAMHWSWEATSSQQALLGKALIGPVLFFILALALWVHYDYVYYPNWDYSPAYELWSSIGASLSDSISRVWLTATSVTAFGLVSQARGHSEPDLTA